MALKRKLNQNQDINYWKNKDGLEVDFIIREGLKVKDVIQVVYEMDEEKTKQREIKSILSCAKELKLKEGTIITKDLEKIEKIDGVKINFIPLWKWLLK